MVAVVSPVGLAPSDVRVVPGAGGVSAWPQPASDIPAVVPPPGGATSRDGNQGGQRQTGSGTGGQGWSPPYELPAQVFVQASADAAIALPGRPATPSAASASYRAAAALGDMPLAAEVNLPGFAPLTSGRLLDLTV